jgi:hypothetical protein
MTCEQYVERVLAALVREQDNFKLQVELERQMFLQDLQDSQQCMWESRHENQKLCC